MRLLLWALPPVVAFGLGLAVAWVPPQPSPTPSEVAQLRASERRLQMQVSTLQARLRAREARDAVPPQTMSAHAPEAPPTQEKVAPAPEVDARAVRAAAARPEPQPERSAPATGAPAARPATVEAALEGFYRYLEDTSASGAVGRWQKLQQLADDLRRMGVPLRAPALPAQPVSGGRFGRGAEPPSEFPIGSGTRGRRARRRSRAGRACARPGRAGGR